MNKKLLYVILASVSIMLYMSACDNNVSSDFQDSLELFTGLEQIPEASNTNVVINKGDNVGMDSYFQLDIRGADSNLLIQNGVKEGWCLEWKKPLRSNNDEHKGVKWYSTLDNNKWKPLNYFLSIKDDIVKDDPTITFREVQAIIWTLAGEMNLAPEFNLDKLSDSELPSRLLLEGKANFSKEKVKSISARVLSEYKTASADSYTLHGVVGETDGDEQTVITPEEPLDPCREDIAESGKVDVMLLFDDTGSFAGSVSAIQSLLPSVIATLEADFPDIDFGFGVSRFEDYGGPGRGFSSETSSGRPFILNQPIVTIDDAGDLTARDNLISEALNRTGAGFGGDSPETAIHALYELGTGLGFDGNGDGTTTESGDAGSVSSQTSPGSSGDVPAFSTNVLPSSGSLGGAGWRSDAQKIIILATDVCTVSTFDSADGIPDFITGQSDVTEAISRFACSSISAGSGRFGFISDAKSTTDNTITGAVAPEGSPTVQETIDALTSLGIQVVGLSTGSGFTDASGPSLNPDIFLSAVANLTGAIDEDDNPLVFPLSTSPDAFSEAIVGAIGASVCDVDDEESTAKARFERYTTSPATTDDDTTRVSNYVIFE